VHWIQHDLTQPLDLACLPRQANAVIHLAQSKLYRHFPDHAEDIFQVNVQSTFQLLNYARQAGVENFIYASSGGVYGYASERFTENDPVKPLNFYLSSKYAAELLLANYQSFFRTTVLRFFFVYGPGQAAGMLIPRLFSQVREGALVTIEGKPGLRINPIYVEDAVRVFLPVLKQASSAIFNVAGDETVTLTELVQLIEQATGRRAKIHYTPAQPTGDLIGDNTRMKDSLGVRPQIGLSTGLERLL
jgi:nucleoside-diphosphate-sugar epimerase